MVRDFNGAGLQGGGTPRRWSSKGAKLQEALLANAGLQLPDGGQKVRAKLDELRAEVAEKRRLLAARTPQGAGAGPPAGSADAFAAGGGAPKRLAFGEGEDPLEPVGEEAKETEAADALDAALSGLAL